MVLLTHGYFIQDDPKEQLIMKPYPPLGILYLAAWMDKYGVENEVFDTTFSTKRELFEDILLKKPRVVALYTNLMTKLNVIDIVRFIKNNDELKHICVVLGGPDVTHNLEGYLSIGTDLIVIGEGEQTMLEIAMTTASNDELQIANYEITQSPSQPITQLTNHPVNQSRNQQFSHINGLAYLLEDGSIHKTTPRTKLRELSELPEPARHKINLQKYLDAWKQRHGQSAISLSTQRGCPYTCKWCSTAVYGQSYRRRSPDEVVTEIQELQKNYNFDLIWFVDDVFTVSHKWLEEFKIALQTKAVKVQFECITRADRMNEGVIKTLKECGCFRVWIGAESGSQKVIDAMDRRVDVEQVRRMIKYTRKIGIETGTFIMLGYPGETEADIKETVEHLKDSNPDLFTITVAYPIKGTGMYEEVESTSFSALDWAERTDRDIEFKRTYPRRYYDFAVRWTVNSVNFHKKRLAGKLFSISAGKLFLKMSFAKMGMIYYRVS
jgi:anaerobic magnesium-protoporphyrin IX monomethyl ester cyclase